MSTQITSNGMRCSHSDGNDSRLNPRTNFYSKISEILCDEYDATTRAPESETAMAGSSRIRRDFRPQLHPSAANRAPCQSTSFGPEATDESVMQETFDASRLSGLYRDVAAGGVVKPFSTSTELLCGGWRL